MAGLTDWLSKKSEVIELGIIQSRESDKTYRVKVFGKEKIVYNTLSISLSVSDRVLVSKLHSGKRYILSKTGFNGDYNSSITTEVTIDG